jgi:hypothetical protein
VEVRPSPACEPAVARAGCRCWDRPDRTPFRIRGRRPGAIPRARTYRRGTAGRMPWPGRRTCVTIWQAGGIGFHGATEIGPNAPPFGRLSDAISVPRPPILTPRIFGRRVASRFNRAIEFGRPDRPASRPPAGGTEFVSDLDRKGLPVRPSLALGPPTVHTSPAAKPDAPACRLIPRPENFFFGPRWRRPIPPYLPWAHAPETANDQRTPPAPPAPAAP